MTMDINHPCWDIRKKKRKKEADPSGKLGLLPWTSVVQMHLVSKFFGDLFSYIHIF